MESACVAEQSNKKVSVERVENRVMVELKISRSSTDDAIGRLQLASPLTATKAEPKNLWLGRKRWKWVTTSLSPITSSATLASRFSPLSKMVNRGLGVKQWPMVSGIES